MRKMGRNGKRTVLILSLIHILRLGAGESHSYVLEWKWPYESGNDGIDTAAGEAGESYRVRLKISAQQEAP